MPGLIALVTQAWIQEGDMPSDRVAQVRVRLMHRAHALDTEQVLAGQTVHLLVKDDGDHYFQIPRPRGLAGLDLKRVASSIRRRVSRE